ncbi:MAG: murein L,D-transpeptidase catalytic domain family protein, partial [Myxococcota bacterium]
SLHSSERRMWILDLADGALLWNLHVTHGEGTSGSDAGYAEDFSNIHDSHQSSLGVMRSGEIYNSSVVGRAMRIDGLESTWNGEVRARGIVMHGATYARPSVVTTYGRLGESWGCPAIDDRENDEVIETLTDGSLLLFWYPDGDWSERSTYLR